MFIVNDFRVFLFWVNQVLVARTIICKCIEAFSSGPTRFLQMFIIKGINPRYKPTLFLTRLGRNCNFKHISVVLKKFGVIEKTFESRCWFTTKTSPKCFKIRIALAFAKMFCVADLFFSGGAFQ